jgi:hypothetical protein
MAEAASAQASAPAASASAPPPLTHTTAATVPAAPQARASAAPAPSAVLAPSVTLAPSESPEVQDFLADLRDMTDEGRHELHAKLQHLLDVHQRGAARLQQLLQGTAILGRILGQADGTLAISEEDALLLFQHAGRLNHLENEAGGIVTEHAEGLREGVSAPVPAPVPFPPPPAQTQTLLQTHPPSPRQQLGGQPQEGGESTRAPTALTQPNAISLLQRMLTLAAEQGARTPPLQQQQQHEPQAPIRQPLAAQAAEQQQTSAPLAPEMLDIFQQLLTAAAHPGARSRPALLSLEPQPLPRPALPAPQRHEPFRMPVRTQEICLMWGATQRSGGMMLWA